MSWSRRQLGLAALMLLTGSINTLAAKWADNFSAGGCGETGEHRFQHPFLQAVGMFLGEFSCLGVFYLLLWRDRRRSEPRMAPPRPYNPLLFLPPALCDMTGTSIMYVGCNRVCGVQTLYGEHHFGGAQGITTPKERLLDPNPSSRTGLRGGIHPFGSTPHPVTSLPPLPHPLIGFFTLIGFFGFVLLALLLIPMYYIPAGGFSSNPRGVLEDAPDAFCQVARRPIISVALLGTVTSIAFFNFAGLSVTKELSATTRMVLDSLRTLAVWGFGLILGWESAHGCFLRGLFEAGARP
uniref:Uncharacterized protein n=1 Tax=Anas zonorhyncha TaxID=75864 RepID=A0A8B9UVB5_9AVES